MQTRALGVPLALVGLGALAALNVLLAERVASTGTREVLLLALLPAALLSIGALVASSRGILVFAALASGIIGGTSSESVSGTGGVLVYPADILVCLALGAWVAAWLSAPPERRPHWPRTPVLGWPLLLFAAPLVYGILQGHERYATGFLSGPVRLIFYAGIAAAIANLSPGNVLKWITGIFYAGTLWHVSWGALRIAEGSSFGELSTGGSRIASLSTAGYLAGALAIALINLELDERPSRRGLHLCFAALAWFGVMIAFGRTVLLALAVVLPLLLFAFRRSRAAVVIMLPLVAPALVLAGLLFPRAAPEVLPAFRDRVAVNDVRADDNVRWRELAYAAVWEQQIRGSPITGVGFGYRSTFTLDGNTSRVEDPHNGYLYLWAGGGLLTLAGFLALYVVFVRDAWRRFRASSGVGRGLVAWCLAMWFILAVTASTTPFLTQPRIALTMWIVLLLPSVVRAGGREPAAE